MAAQPPDTPVVSRRIVIGIPTYRRLPLLKALLETLLSQAAEADAVVIIADNACEDAVRDAIAAYAMPAVLHYLPVPARGVSQARNAIVATAHDLRPDWDWLLMLDDDGLATPNWIATLIAAGEAHGADLVGGPVTGVLPQGASFLARCSVFAARKRWPTGPVAMLNTTQNLGIARKLLDRVALPLFDRRFGASGGEDYDLFRRTAQSGGTLVWCDEAEVLEPAPAERLTVPALLHRYYSTGTYMAMIDAGYDGWGQGLLTASKGVLGASVRAIAGLLTGHSDKAARSTLMTAHYVGRFAGLIGVRTARYVEKDTLAS